MTSGTALSAHLVTGPPGAGKTTALIALEAQHPQLTRFGVRDYGLKLAEAGDPLGLAARDTLTRGELLPDELVLLQFAHFLDHLPAEVRSVVVEGYPRDGRQCADLVGALEARGGRVASYIVLEVPDELVRARVARRLICARCGLPVPEAAPGACSECGGPVKTRDDDAAARLDRRLAGYRRLGADVRAYFEARGLLRIVDGRRDPAEVRGALAGLLVPEAPAPDGEPALHRAGSSHERRAPSSQERRG
ncbi:nucleoside monophosphate kinase [Streptomyces sp. NPDC005408]|uniref:adenylate kinase family protein n=1 Tax=Streptomyces sp. NPDC005408 TaxID=3155341 RepID=UPI0033AEFB59